MDTPVMSVDFHFDIMCPWAYQASIWMRYVRDRLGLQVRWRIFGLEEINRAIATTFQPYLEARDWVTIQKETP
jgi:protein-disulfide isomerase-like protein with CxxC motif